MMAVRQSTKRRTYQLRIESRARGFFVRAARVRAPSAAEIAYPERKGNPYHHVIEYRPQPSANGKIAHFTVWILFSTLPT
jgi:hypothetical protein